MLMGNLENDEDYQMRESKRMQGKVIKIGGALIFAIICGVIASFFVGSGAVGPVVFISGLAAYFLWDVIVKKSP